LKGEDREVSWIDRVYNKLTAPKTVRYCGYLVLLLYIGLLTISVLVAAVFGPGGYSVTTHFISALGDSDTTPVPILYDLACIAAGSLTIPFTLYLERYIAPIPKRPEELPAPHRWNYRLMELSFFFSMLGSIFYVGVGIFSADRDMVGWIDMHSICSYGAFGGFAFSALFLGIAVTFAHQPIVPKPINYPLGLWGMIGPIMFAVFNLTGLKGWTSELLEWSLLWAIMAWIIPLALYTIRHSHKIEMNGKSR